MKCSLASRSLPLSDITAHEHNRYISKYLEQFLFFRLQVGQEAGPCEDFATGFRIGFCNPI